MSTVSSHDGHLLIHAVSLTVLEGLVVEPQGMLVLSLTEQGIALLFELEELLALLQCVCVCVCVRACVCGGTIPT